MDNHLKIDSLGGLWGPKAGIVSSGTPAGIGLKKSLLETWNPKGKSKSQLDKGNFALLDKF